MSVSDKEWTVATEAGVVLGTFPKRGDVFAIVRRVPGCTIARIQRFRFAEAPKPGEPGYVAPKARAKRQRKGRASSPVTVPEEIGSETPK